MNQIISSSFAVIDYCRTILQEFWCLFQLYGGLALAALIMDTMVWITLASASSHNASAEKQFRYLLVRHKTTYSTVDADRAGACVLAKRGDDPGYFCWAGKIVDMGSTFNMGSAMAPAVETILFHFRDMNINQIIMM